MILKTITVISLSTTLFAFSLNSIVTDSVGDIVNGIGKGFGLPKISVQCDIGVKNIDLYNICSITNKLDVDLGGNFKIGSCSVNVADPLSCQRRALKDFCNRYARKGENGAKGYLVGASESIASSSEEILSSGGKIIGDFTNCNYVENVFENKKTSSGKTLKEVYEESSFKKMKKNGIFNSLTKDIRDCLKSEKDKTACLKTGEWQLPETISDVEKDISTASTQAVPNTTSYLKASFGTESQLSKKMHEQCKDSPSSSECIKKVAKEEEHAKKRDAVISNIESSAAIRMKLMEKSARRKREIVFRGSDVVKRLPIEMKSQYISAVKRANAVDIITENLYSQNINLSKEAIVLIDNKIVDSSVPFLEKDSIERIKELMR